eukprot:3932415-Rhodomonas_salina.3
MSQSTMSKAGGREQEQQPDCEPSENAGIRIIFERNSVTFDPFRSKSIMLGIPTHREACTHLYFEHHHIRKLVQSMCIG